jgi:zinc transport system ATP-binding protein
MKKTIFTVSNLKVIANHHTLVHGVNFELHEGDILALIGPNGSGKTTVLKSLLDLIPYEGKIVWAKQMNIGYVPQRFTYDANFPLTVSELLTLRIKKTSFWFHTKKTHSIITAALKNVGAERLVHRRIGYLSSGELQRVLLAYALVTNPEILFLDEPVTGIDIEGEENFYNLVSRLNKEKGITIIIVSHDLNIVYKYAAEVICLNKKMLCFGPPRKALTAAALKEVYGQDITSFKHSH